MGTPDFARVSLEKLADSGADIVGVVTQPDKPKGRKMLPTPSEVKAFAVERGLDVYQPSTLKDESFAELLQKLDPELIIVAAYGKLLPESVINYPALGCINVHGSLLPKYRGAAPIQRAIMNGEAETGITIMYMDVGLDTGDMLAKVSTPISEDDNFESVHDRLAALGAELLIETVEKIEAGNAERIKQKDDDSTYAAKITNADCALSFDTDADSVHNLVRGLSPYPLAVVKHNGKNLKLETSFVMDRERCHDLPGKILNIDAKKNYFEVACRRGSVGISRIQPEGKGRMAASDYINGRKIAVGDIFGTV